MLRHPMKMVYSQFLMCKYSIRLQDKGFPRQGTGVKSGLKLWAQRLLNRNATYAWACYHSRDIQTRYLATAQSAWTVPKHPPMLSKALASLGKAYFVGLAEAYPQSACLLRMLTTHSKLEYCRCGSTELGPRLTHERHKVPKANLNELDSRGAPAAGEARPARRPVVRAGHREARCAAPEGRQAVWSWRGRLRFCRPLRQGLSGYAL